MTTFPTRTTDIDSCFSEKHASDQSSVVPRDGRAFGGRKFKSFKIHLSEATRQKEAKDAGSCKGERRESSPSRWSDWQDHSRRGPGILREPIVYSNPWILLMKMCRGMQGQLQRVPLQTESREGSSRSGSLSPQWAPRGSQRDHDQR